MRRRRRPSRARYALGLAGALAALVAVQVIPKLDDYTQRMGGSPVEAAAGAAAGHGGARWRLISLAPSGGEDLPAGTRPVTAVIGVTPAAESAGKAMAKGCEAAVRDAAGRVWGRDDGLPGVQGVAQSCLPTGKDNKPLPARPGVEIVWQASFVVPADALSSLRVEIRLAGADGFVRLAPPAAPA
ncbi:MAG TPA: hypothetical protein VFV66_15500 [Nonomuraea sp.]|nr:hypothetical protein [Nonomuraea sp.]